MTDINSGSTEENAADGSSDGDAVEVARSDAVVENFIELLFFAYRDFTGEPDGILDEFGFGRAHHRVLHFVHRNPGLRVADLLDILKITKQSLARVLKQLVSDGFILQQPGVADRRERHLYVTNRGRLLAEKLLRLQTRRIGAALAAAGPEAHEVIQRFLVHIISEPDRQSVIELVGLANRGRPSEAEESGPTPAFKPSQ
jgi:DNA-binding MarR family transcriptional regulator